MSRFMNNHEQFPRCPIPLPGTCIEGLSVHATRRMYGLVLFFLLFSSLGVKGEVSATETKVVVRALAKDGMFIGTSMGGAHIIIREVDSGMILAQGRTGGDTGPLATVMQEPRKRGQPLSNASTAKFEARLDLEEPTFVSIEALAPYGQRRSSIRVSTQLWVIPGRDILGDGVILEFPGFVVDILTPQPAERVSLSAGKSVPLTVNVVMMCGCPIEPGGLWDAGRYEIAGLVKRNGLSYKSVPFVYSGKTSTFAGTLDLSEPGLYEVQVYAFDSGTGNTGLDSVVFKVQD
jgi:hypothetical protein